MIDVMMREFAAAHRACKELLETSPYLCLCGTGLVKVEECEWHQAVNAAAEALYKIGYGPSWLKKEKDNGNAAEDAGVAGSAEPGGSGSFGAPDLPPNCS